MFNCIDDFYEPYALGLQGLVFQNSYFTPTYQSYDAYYGSDRLKAYPTYETSPVEEDSQPFSCYNLFKETFEKKTNIKILKVKTFFRKTKLHEMKQSPCWGTYKQHVDPKTFDLAGLVYFNSHSLKDGTYFYNDLHSFEPTAIVAAKPNRCIFYNPQLPHNPPYEQEIEERWTQPFFIVYKEETLEKFKNES